MVSGFTVPSPSQDVTPSSPWPGIIKLFLGESLSDIPAWDRRTAKPFLQCTWWVRLTPTYMPHYTQLRYAKALFSTPHPPELQVGNIVNLLYTNG